MTHQDPDLPIRSNERETIFRRSHGVVVPRIYMPRSHMAELMELDQEIARMKRDLANVAWKTDALEAELWAKGIEVEIPLARCREAKEALEERLAQHEKKKGKSNGIAAALKRKKKAEDQGEKGTGGCKAAKLSSGACAADIGPREGQRMVYLSDTEE